MNALLVFVLTITIWLPLVQQPPAPPPPPIRVEIQQDRSCIVVFDNGWREICREWLFPKTPLNTDIIEVIVLHYDHENNDGWQTYDVTQPSVWQGELMWGMLSEDLDNPAAQGNLWKYTIVHVDGRRETFLLPDICTGYCDW